MSQGTTPTTRTRAPKGEGHRLRQELIDAASDLLADLGDAHQLSIRAVAAACGVTPPSLYRHFADKEALLVAVLTERWAEFRELLLAAAEAGSDPSDPFERLRRMCVAYLAYAEERPGHYRVLFGAAAPAGITAETEPADHPGAPTFLALVQAVEACLAARPEPTDRDRDPFFVAMQVWLTGHGLVDLRIGQRFPFPWPPAEALLDAMLTDLRLTRP